VVVATRYFGGTKLGTGGLVKAYTETAQAALAAVPVELKIETVLLRVELAYDSFAPCRKRMEDLGADIEDEQFADVVQLRVRVAIEQMQELRTALVDMTSGRAQVDQIE
jgi:putative IMPACT (imprinted ancient) family translation regulator